MNDEELTARLSDAERAANGVPDEETSLRRVRAAAAVEAALGDLLLPGGIRTSPLGPGWSSDVDAHMRTVPEPERLESRGWMRLDRLLTALGSPGRGRWAIVEQGEVLGTADLHTTTPPEPAAALLDRCRRLGEVRLREVLELRELLGRGIALPEKDAVLSAAADAEAAFGGDRLARWRTGRPRRPPVMLPGTKARRAAKRLLRRRGLRVGVAISGVDGAGKSTVTNLLVRDLERLGVPASIVWTRPGMRISFLDPLARSAKRLLREKEEPGVLRLAAEPDRRLRSRRGRLGWTWATLVTLSFLHDVRRRARGTNGVIVYDRHLLDALVTLSFAYRGVDLRAQRRLVRRWMPPAAAVFYLSVSAEVAAARKPGDAIGEAAVRRQLEVYSSELEAVPGIVVLDASHSLEELGRRVLKGFLGMGETRQVRGEAPAAPHQR